MSNSMCMICKRAFPGDAQALKKQNILACLSHNILYLFFRSIDSINALPTFMGWRIFRQSFDWVETLKHVKNRNFTFI